MIYRSGFKSANGCHVTKRAIIDVNSIVSGRNYAILTSIIAQVLTSRHVTSRATAGRGWLVGYLKYHF